MPAIFKELLSKTVFLRIAASNFRILEHVNLITAISRIATGLLPAQQILVMKIVTSILFIMSCLAGSAIKSPSIVTTTTRQTSISKWQLHNNHKPRGKFNVEFLWPDSHA